MVISVSTAGLPVLVFCNLIMTFDSLLVERGFGLLMYDMRAHGRSTGNFGTWGWLEVNDLNGAADYLMTRQEVDPNRIGAMGFSLGGQITIRGVSENDSIKAILVEDPSPAVLADHPMPQDFLSASYLTFLLFGWFTDCRALLAECHLQPVY